MMGRMFHILDKKIRRTQYLVSGELKYHNINYY